jgi:hypothetical protein
MKNIGEAGAAICVSGRSGSKWGLKASRLPGMAIFDNLVVRVSAEVGRHSCEKGK